MILFWSIAAALVAVALLFVLPPLLRRRAPPPSAREAANAAVYREQLADLQAELERGTLGKAEYETARREVERRVVAENAAEHAAELALAAQAPRAARRTAVAIGLALPAAAIVAYLVLGTPDGLNPAAAPVPQEMEALVERLSAQLQKSPGDAEAWALLGRALGNLGHYERAAQALARSLQLDQQQHEVLVDFIKTLAMAGRAEFEARNYDAAIAYWERILPFAPPESEFAKTVRDSIAEAREAAGSASAAAGTRIEGTVSLSPALKDKVAPGDTVFILARAPGGARMPLAVTRTTVDKLPYRFTLDDAMAMTPTAKISDHAKVIVIARISKSGTPTPQKGDVEGVSPAIAPGTTGVDIVLSKVIP
jgi:cytochrome c-type biogenesis protein CcmH